MVENLCVQKILQIRYSFPRFQWLIGTMSLISLLYLTSEEIWKIVDMVKGEGFVYYIAFFLIGLTLVHYIDTKKIVQRRSLALATSLISIAIDLFLISISELVVLYTIQVLPQNILDGFIMLLIGAMPSAMGSIVLTSLTSETLKQRAKKLYEEAQDLGRQVAKLENQRKRAMESLKSFEKRKREFENYFKKQGKEGRRGKDVK